MSRGGAAVAELVRAFHPQEFLDRGADRLGVGGEVAHGVGIAEQQIDALPIRLVVVSWPALSRKMQLCRSSASDSRSPPLPANSLASISVDRISPLDLRAFLLAARDEIAQISLEIGDGGHAALELLPRQHRLQRAEDFQRPVAERRALVLGDAEQVADQLHRDRGGEVRDQVDRAALGRGIEQAVDQRLDARLHARGACAA